MSSAGGLTPAQGDARPTIYRVLIAISIVHLINDAMQAIVPAILPLLKETMNLTYLQAGMIVFTLNMTSSVLQPVVGYTADKRPMPLILPFGVFLTTVGVLGIAFAPNYLLIVASVFLLGLGSAIFHPEAARVAYLAGGARRGHAQAIFQVGGNAGSSLAPVMTAFIFVPFGQLGALSFTALTTLAIVIQIFVAGWYRRRLPLIAPTRRVQAAPGNDSIHAKQARSSTHTSAASPGNPALAASGGTPAYKLAIRRAIVFIIFLLFVRTWYNASVSIYYPFYFMEKFGLSVQQVQVYIFLFTGCGVVGTLFGGALSDRFGRKNIMFYSMVGVAPLSLLLPYAGPVTAAILIGSIGFIMMSGWAVTVVYAQELVPGRIGTVSGLTTGMAFGLGAIGAVAVGGLADSLGLQLVLHTMSFLPLLGLIGAFLPSDRKVREWYSA